jgi:RNA polymerase sigma-70 factor (ECF subfamily)
VRAAQRGDREAFGALYLRFGRYVHGLLLARLPPDEAADLVHDVFLLALERLHKLREPSAFGGWLAAIARNRTTDAMRQRHPHDPLAEPTSPASSPETLAGARQALNAIQSLPLAYRETLVLRLVHGMTGPEIAGATGLTPGSVRVNLHRGLALLREALGVAT